MMVGFLVKALFLVHKDHLFVCSFGSERGSKIASVSLYKGANLIMRAFRTQLPPKTPPQNSITLRLEFQLVTFEGYKHLVHSKCSRKKKN